MHTIKEEPEEDEQWMSEEELEEKFIRKKKTRESLSKIEVRDKIRSVGGGWAEYVTPSGRLYYYNTETKEKSWKPPRRVAKGCEESSCYSESEPADSCSSIAEPRLFDEEIKSTNVGKILRTGVLKTTEIGDDRVKNKKKKKWVKSFVVLTEFCILFTTIVGSFRKLFGKGKCSKPNRFYLRCAEVVKEQTKSRGRNVYRLKTLSRDILFKSKNPTAAESWYQALTLVINNVNSPEEPERRYDLNERERTNSFDLEVTLRKKDFHREMETKSASIPDFNTTDAAIDGSRRKCLSDFFGIKYPTPPGWISIFDGESGKFCYVNCITGKKWFWALTEDGHPYFYEEGFGRRSWLLPSIYLDVNSKTLEDIRRSMGSRKSLQTDF